MSSDQGIPSFSHAFPDNEQLCPYHYPPFEAIRQPGLMGLLPPSEDQRKHCDAIIAGTPTGPRPIDIAQSFIDRFYKNDPRSISQWPSPQPWNPLIVHFFDATDNPANNDTVPWCAAFVNWCLKRAGKPTTNSSSSQSFATSDAFPVTTSPKEGDILVFTCYSKSDGKNLGIGHVTFFKESIGENTFSAVGGNQTGTFPSMISEEEFQKAFESRRHLNGNYVPVIYRVNRFLRIE
ncbi:hypothetical protein R69608_05085 [Paraburkholderia nemoris]|uniref:CHAP domain-containing protein n=1 Tax=Paraburkholderia nemoris TaxID=2793076 RepID=UPI0019137D5A|nr:CHAP domain-containing protein [Paraburkholderia nemoris]MBK5149708.1 CHAP domain-containing protein [Burkholderia sp. R-69608]CAE6938330.1 hypothetical protein R69608_05085 [Paraburkholderia nemoris]